MARGEYREWTFCFMDDVGEMQTWYIRGKTPIEQWNTFLKAVFSKLADDYALKGLRESLLIEANQDDYYNRIREDSVIKHYYQGSRKTKPKRTEMSPKSARTVKDIKQMKTTRQYKGKQIKRRRK